MTTAQTLTSGFTSALNRLNPVKSLQTPKTKAIAKARDKAGQSWRELVEAAHREKTEPEAYVIERLAAEVGLQAHEAVAAFQTDVKDFAATRQAIARLKVVEKRLTEQYKAHGEEADVGFTATVRLKREALVKQLKELDAEVKIHTRDVTAWQGHQVTLRQTVRNTRLFPDGIVETFTTTKEKE